jgi:4-diphosphocytidyl-2-C-methyl-D-erythritol kinase
MRLEKKSPCKVNLLLNILGKRADGFHELETVMQPVNLCDELAFERGGKGVLLSCSDGTLPTDSRNLIHRAAGNFLSAAKISDGVKIHLEKKVPIAAGLGGGSGNAASTLLALNEMFGQPLSNSKLNELAASLGSDVNFFLQNKPALATGRGEKIQSLENFPALRGRVFLLIHPGFGISTPWAYQNLTRFPAALNGQKGRAQKLISLLQTADLKTAAREFHNSLEAPALEKFPILELFQEFLCANGALAALMSGSGSTTFAIADNVSAAGSLENKFKSKFGQNCWTAIVAI